MVIVDYTTRENFYEVNTSDVQRQRMALDESISNFCPRLRQSMNRLSRHKVGPLKQNIQLSDFQCSSTFMVPTKAFMCTQYPRNDMFVLSMPYLTEEISSGSNHNYMVRWSIIAQCAYPNRAPEVILLGMDDLSVVTGYTSTIQARNNQRFQPRQHQIDSIYQESFWQQFVATDAFQLKCLSKWDKLNSEVNLSLQYCLLADQLYECYANFQFYKLKMSLKAPLMIHPPAHLIQAHTQYKQLVKLSKIASSEAHPTDINVELFVDIDTFEINEFEVCRNQTNSSLVRLRAILKLLSFEQPDAPLTTTSCVDDTSSHLISLTATYSYNEPGSKNNGAENWRNKNYFVRILNPKLSGITKQGVCFVMILESLTHGAAMVPASEFVTYVNKVRNAAINAIAGYTGKKNGEDIDDPARLLFEILLEKFCSLSSNGNCLLDYGISDGVKKNNISFIRFLLVDKDLLNESNQLKYILSVEYKKDELEKKTTIKQLSPIVSIRSVYDEKYEHILDIPIPDKIRESDKYELAAMIETAAINGMQHLNNEVIIPALIRYKREQSSVDLDQSFLSQLSLQ